MEALAPWPGWLGQHLRAVVLIGSLVDAVGLPFPGRVVLVAAGALAPTWTEVVILTLVATAGSLLGDHVLYAAGALGGTRLLDLSCRLSLASSRCSERALRDLDRLGGTAVLLGRFSAGVRLFAAAMAGSGRMGYPRFLVYDAAGTVVYVALWLALGHVFGALALERSRIGPVALVLVPLALGVLIGWRLRRRRRHGPATAAGLRRRPARRPGP